jgi:hypothetical protein
VIWDVFCLYEHLSQTNTSSILNSVT